MRRHPMTEDTYDLSITEYDATDAPSWWTA
jgi:hypothetical protein